MRIQRGGGRGSRPPLEFWQKSGYLIAYAILQCGLKYIKKGVWTFIIDEVTVSFMYYKTQQIHHNDKP